MTSNNILHKHVENIKASEEVCHNNLDKSLMFITAFLPHLGYKRCEELLEEFINDPDKDSIKVYLEEKLGNKLVNEVLSAENLTSLGFRPREN